MTLKAVDGETAGSWIRADLKTADQAIVAQQIPQSFERYLRILHPATTSAGESMRWVEVANGIGGRIHPEVQWHCLVGCLDPEEVYDNWDGEPPRLGELRDVELDFLCESLNRHTNCADDFLMGLSTIHGWVRPLATESMLLNLPFREFVIFEGPLACAGTLGRSADPKENSQKQPRRSPGRGLKTRPRRGASTSLHLGSEVAHLPVRKRGRHDIAPKYLKEVGGQAPNLMWPRDRTWCVVSDLDFDSTLLGGSKLLIEELLQEGELECVEVHSYDSLGWDADRVNC